MWRLANPWFLLLLLVPLGLMILHLWNQKRGRASLLFSSSRPLDGLPRTWRAVLSPHLHWLRYLGLTLLVIALARPQIGHEVRQIDTYGVDIMLVLDVSGTMSEEDMADESRRRINRLEAAKRVMDSFIGGREADRIGLIAFGTHSLTRAPLTVDYELVRLALSEISLDLFPREMRRTAIGNALATAVARLDKSDAKSKVVILLTDGQNTSGNIAPLKAAELAASEDIRVYTIGFGTPNRADVDEDNLRQIAEETGGRFFRSTSLSDLQRVYELIDEMEKSEVVVNNFQLWDEWFVWFLWAGTAVLLLELLMDQVFCRRVP